MGENYLLFTARTSAGEPSLETGIATPGDTHKERLLNGEYDATQITSRFEGGMFTQNIKGPRETFIYNTMHRITNILRIFRAATWLTVYRSY